jgi:hypothetical protein
MKTKRKPKRWCVWVTFENAFGLWFLAATFENVSSGFSARALAREYAEIVWTNAEQRRILPEGRRPK